MMMTMLMMMMLMMMILLWAGVQKVRGSTFQSGIPTGHVPPPTPHPLIIINHLHNTPFLFEWVSFDFL